jgi:8-oxo-dGTP pyrophosphatase MutT (NUDIX family)
MKNIIIASGPVIVENYKVLLNQHGDDSFWKFCGGRVEEGEFNLKQITGDIVPTLNNTLLETQHMIIRLDGLMEQYEKSPGDILYKTQEIKKGPGE